MKRLADFLARSLSPDEREAVYGDLAELSATSSEAFRQIFGLVLRRQWTLWFDWRPWLTLTAVAIPAAVLLSLTCFGIDGSLDLYLWIIRNRTDIAPSTLSAIGISIGSGLTHLAARSLILAAWSFATGFVIGSLSPRTSFLNGSVFIASLLFAAPSLLRGHRPYQYSVGGGELWMIVYAVVLPMVLLLILVLWPSIFGMTQGLDRNKGVRT